jgi:CHAD domain-containing protein
MADELESAQKALRELAKTLKSLPRDPLPEQVHKLRTATRRVEAIAPTLVDKNKSERLLKSIGPVRKAAGGVRDMDVLISKVRKLARYFEQKQNSRALPKSLPGGFSSEKKPLKGRAIGFSYSGSAVAGDSLARLVEQMQIARQQNAVELRRALGRRRDAARQNLKQCSKLIQSALIPVSPAASANGQGHEGVHAAAMSVARELGEWAPLDASNIHAFRLKAKELRYILQLSADANSGLVDALGQAQRRIGDWHDWQKLEEIARETLDPERDGALLKHIGQSVERRLDRALSAANALRGKYLSMPDAQEI